MKGVFFALLICNSSNLNCCKMIIAQLNSEQLSRLIQNSVRKVLKETATEQDRLLTVHEAADFLKLTAPTIYAKVSRGELPHMKLGKRLYFSSAELRSYLKAEGKNTNAKAEQDAESYLSKKGGFNG